MSELPIIAPGYEEPDAESELDALSGCLMNTCVVDEAVLTEALRVAMDRPFFRVLRWVERLVMAAALGLLIWAVAAKQSVITVLEAVFLLAMAAFFYLQQFVFYPRKAVKNQLARQAVEDGQAALVNRIYFTEANVANRRGEGDLVLHMGYEKLKRLSETPRLLILTTRSNRLIPLDKRGFANGTAEDLKKLLARKAPNLK